MMKSFPKFLVGPYRAAMRFAMTENEMAANSGDELRCTRAWKLFLLLPRMVLHKPPRGGLLPKSQMLDRFSTFNRGQSINLLIMSQDQNVHRKHSVAAVAHIRTTVWSVGQNAPKHWCKLGSCLLDVVHWKTPFLFSGTWQFCANCRTL